MSIAALEAKALRHWKEFLPNRVARLRKEGILQEEAHAAAKLAQEEIEFLMKYRHYQEHEAEEVALPLFILLSPHRDDPDEEPED